MARLELEGGKEGEGERNGGRGREGEGRRETERQYVVVGELTF